MKRIFSSPDYKQVIIYHLEDGFCEPIIAETQEIVDQTGEKLKELWKDESLEIKDVFSRIDWFETTDKVDIAAIIFYSDCSGDTDYDLDTWKDQANEFRKNVSNDFIDTVLSFNTF